MICYGLIGTTEHTPMPDYAPWDNRPEGWILMNYMKPDSRPDRFGDWYARADGEWIWQKYPDPPFAVAYYQGKLINADSMLEILPETLPGQVASRLSDVESGLSGIANAMAQEVAAAQQASAQAQQYAESAGSAAQQAVDTAISALPRPTQFEIVTVTLGSGGAATATFANSYSAPPAIIPIPRWGGASSEQLFLAVPGTANSTEVTVSGKRSRGTLLLTAGAFESAGPGDVVQFFAIGR